MSKRRVQNGSSTGVENVTIIIYPADSRPVTAWALDNFDATGEIFFSPGTAADMMLLKWWLDFLGNAAADEYMERHKRELDRDEQIDGTSSVDIDDVPF